MRPDVQRAQRKLIELGLLPAGSADGVFGEITLAAANKFLAMRQLDTIEKPVTQAEIDRLSGALFPKPDIGKPISTNPLQNWLIGLAIKQAVSVLKGSIPMNVLSGYKTYIIAVLMILLAVAGLLGWTVPGVNSDPGALILGALGLITGRNGAKNDVSKALGN